MPPNHSIKLFTMASICQRQSVPIFYKLLSNHSVSQRRTYLKVSIKVLLIVLTRSFENYRFRYAIKLHHRSVSYTGKCHFGCQNTVYSVHNK